MIRYLNKSYWQGKRNVLVKKQQSFILVKKGGGLVFLCFVDWPCLSTLRQDYEVEVFFFFVSLPTQSQSGLVWCCCFMRLFMFNRRTWGQAASARWFLVVRDCFSPFYMYIYNSTNTFIFHSLNGWCDYKCLLWFLRWKSTEYEVLCP